MLFAENELQPEEIPTHDADAPERKSKGSRMRSVWYLKWRKRDIEEPFESWYTRQFDGWMERLEGGIGLMREKETAEQRRDRFARMGHTGGAARVPKGFSMMTAEQVQAASAKGTATRRANAAARAQAKQDKWAAGEIKQGTSK